MSRILVLALLLFALWPTEAPAVVATCGQTWAQQCDPYSGECYLVAGGATWTVTRNGVAQPQCADDPTACWLARFTECGAIPPPANPAALRICPWGVDCGVGQPPHPIDGYLPDHRAPAGTVTYYYQGHPSITGPLLPPTLDVNIALDCILYHFPSSPLGDGRPCPPPGDAWVGRGVSPPLVVFEPAPSCGWSIAPASPSVPCEFPIPPMLAQLKWDPTQKFGTIRYARDLDKRIAAMRKALISGEHGPIGSARYSTATLIFNWLLTLSNLIYQILIDPATPHYQSLPGPVTLPTISLPAPDATLSATQLAALGPWLAAVRETAQVAQQMGLTIDHLAGALLAADAAWVRDLAAHADAVSATLSAKGLAEVAARAAVASSATPVSQPAYCLTPTDAANNLRTVVLTTGLLFPGSLAYERALTTCGDASAWPTWLTQDAPADNAMWASLAPLGLADRLCAANASYCSAPTLTLIAPNGGEAWPTGSTQTITWTSAGLAGAVSLLLSTDGGATYPTTLASSVPNTGAYSWLVPATPTGTARIRVKCATCTPVVKDSSDGNVALVSPASIRVTRPNKPGINWAIGASQSLTWDSVNIPGLIEITLSKDGGVTWSAPLTPAGGIANTGSFTWLIAGPIATPTTQARIRVKCVTCTPAVKDASDVNFQLH